MRNINSLLACGVHTSHSVEAACPLFALHVRDMQVLLHCLEAVLSVVPTQQRPRRAWAREPNPANPTRFQRQHLQRQSVESQNR